MCRSQPVSGGALRPPVPAQSQRQRGLSQRDLEPPAQVCPSQVQGAAGRSEERDGGGAQHGPRDGRQVRGQQLEISQSGALSLVQIHRDTLL